MNPLKSLLQEIHRRSLWQVLLVYVAASWAVIEGIQGLTEATGLPEWFPSFAVGLLMVGFPVVLGTAFVQRGMRRREAIGEALDKPLGTRIPTGNSPPRRSPEERIERLFTWRNAILGGVLAFAIWGAIAAFWILILGGSVGSRQAGEADDLGVRDGGSAGGGSRLATMTLAVLPFDNLSPDADNAFFAAGIHEDILTHLSKIPSFTVISRTSVMAYADTDKSVRSIGEELGAGTILEGSVRRAGDRVRITTQLIDTRTDAHLWADTYDRELVDVFEVQSDIARRVAAALEATLSPTDETRLAAAPTSNLSAYDLYLRGRELYNQHTVETHLEAIRLFGAALEMDRDFALAWAGLADAYSQGVNQYGFDPTFADSALTTAERAVDLDSGLSEAHKALGFALALSGQLEQALVAYRRAVELNPNDFAAVNNIGTVAGTAGELDEALVWYRRSTRLAPNSEYARTNAAEIYTLLGDFETADVWLRQAELLHPEGWTVFQQRSYWHLFQGDARAAYENAMAALDVIPEHPAVHSHAGLMALFADQPEQARIHLERSLEMAPGGGWELHLVRLQLGTALIALGEVGTAEEQLAIAESRLRSTRDSGDESAWIDWDLAAVAAQRGDADLTIEYARKAYDAGYRYGIHPDDPMFGPIKGDPRFQDLLADVAREYDRMRASMEATERAEGIR